MPSQCTVTGSTCIMGVSSPTMQCTMYDKVTLFGIVDTVFSD